MSITFHLFFGFLCIFTLFSTFEALTRELKISVNPACNIPECKSTNGSTLNLIHVQAIGPNDTVHYIWSTIYLPSILVAQTSTPAALVIEWNKLLQSEDGALWFTENPKQSIGLVLTKLYKYYDNDDEVKIPNSNLTTILNLTDFNWKPAIASTVSSDSIITFSASASHNDSMFSNGGEVVIKFSASSTAESHNELPHLLFNSNSTQMNMILNNLVTDDKDRFAAEFTAFSSHPFDNKLWIPDTKRTVDDEYSPGVFKVQYLYSPCDEFCETKKKFLMWKPVTYLGEKASVANSTLATFYNLMLSNDTPLSIVSLFYNNTNVTRVSWNMTFGGNGDGFYEHTKYLSWSVMIGLGIPGSEELSLLAKIVIGIGLGAPLFIMCAGSLYLIYKKCRKEDEDELLLDG